MPNIDSIEPQIPNNNSQKPAAKVSLLSRQPGLKVAGGPKTNHPKHVLRKILAIVVLIIVILGAAVLFRAMDLSDKIFVGKKLSFFQKIEQVLAGSTGQIQLTGEDTGQVNILLLGIGGEGHDGPYLTDTMILAQIRPASPDASQGGLHSE